MLLVSGTSSCSLSSIKVRSYSIDSYAARIYQVSASSHVRSKKCAYPRVPLRLVLLDQIVDKVVRLASCPSC